MSQADFMIVIPCLNEEHYIEGLVRKLVADNAAHNFFLVIADGGSQDKTAEIAKNLDAEFEAVRYLHNPKKIQSAAINLAVETYGDDAEYLIRIDAHADYPSDFCEALLADARAQKADSVVVSMDTVGKADFQKAVAAAQNSKLGNGGSAHRNASHDGQWVDHGHHALMRIAAFRDVKGYDESFSHNEDAELDIRLGKMGHKIWLSGSTSMIYYPRPNMKGLFRQYLKFGEGRLKTLMKHRIRPHLRQMIPVGVLPAVIGFLLSGVWAVFAIPAFIWAFICLAYGVLISVKAKDCDLIASGVAIMIMHLAWSCGFWIGAFNHVRGGR